MPECIYCPNPPESAEHWLPRSLGTFGPLQVLNDKICDGCNQALDREIDPEFARGVQKRSFAQDLASRAGDGNDRLGPKSAVNGRPMR